MDKDLAEGVKIPRHTEIAYNKDGDNGTKCKFLTAHEIDLWPIKITDAQYYDDDIRTLGLTPKIKMKSCIRIGMESTAGLNFKNITADSLDFYLRSFNTTILTELYSLMIKECLDIYIQYKDAEGKLYRISLSKPKMQLRQIGLKNEEGLLPYDSREFQLHRIIREYFAFPKRFHFFKLDKIRDALEQIQTDKIDIVFTFGRHSQYLKNNISGNNFLLYSTPVINMMKKRIDRVRIKKNKNEFHIIADRFKPQDYEILMVNKVRGILANNQTFFKMKPIYSASEFEIQNNTGEDYYTIHRRQTERTDKNCNDSYTGSEVFISPLNMHSKSKEIEELSIDALCSNRNIPGKIQVDNKKKSDFKTNVTYPIKGVKLVDGFTVPVPSPFHNNSDWEIINHIKMDYTSLISENGEVGAEIIKKLLMRYAGINSKYDMKQIESIKSIKSEQIVKRLNSVNGLTTVRGIQISIEFDDDFYIESNHFILEMILNSIFQESAPINTFVETIMLSRKHGEMSRWYRENGVTLVK